MKKNQIYPKIKAVALALIILACLAIGFQFLPEPVKVTTPSKTIEREKVAVKEQAFDTGFDEIKERQKKSIRLDFRDAELIIQNFDDIAITRGSREPFEEWDYSKQEKDRVSSIVEEEEAPIVNRDQVITIIKPDPINEPKEDIIDQIVRPKIAIVIDDLGMNFSRLRQLSAIKAPLNFAFLPYAENLDEQVVYASEQGHHLLVHMPMKPKSDLVNPGPIVLRPDMSEAEIEKALNWGLSSFNGFKGINNHMGSAFTANEQGMRVVMRVLKERGYYFLDSKTTPNSQGEIMAIEAGLPYRERDVFLDHVNDLEQIKKRLIQTERIARQRGIAIAIGHPYEATIEALEQWLPTLDEKGFELVTVESVLRYPKKTAQMKADTAEEPMPKSVSGKAAARVIVIQNQEQQEKADPAKPDIN